MNDAVPSMYDPTQFLENQSAGAGMATKYENLPHGARFNFQIKDYKVERIVPEEAGKDPFYTITVNVTCDGNQIDPTTQKPLKERMGRDQVAARYKGYVDLNAQGGWDVGPGKNVAVGALRAAVNQDKLEDWKLLMLKGQTFSGQVSNRTTPDGRTFTDIVNPLPAQ